MGLIGAGKMARAMVEGMLRSGARLPDSLLCTSAADGTGEALAADTGIGWTADAAEVVARADTLVLAMKPQQLADFSVADGERAEGRLILSILAGTSLSTLAERFPRARNIVRIMPNTPGSIGVGVSGWCSRAPLTGEDRKVVEDLLRSLGRSVAVTEAEMDAVTAVSGSGPAYVFEMAAALMAAAEKVDLSPGVARTLVVETLYGAATLLRESDESADQLRTNVTSPGGTTEAALKVFSEHQFRGVIEKAVTAARDRSRVLAGG